MELLTLENFIALQLLLFVMGAAFLLNRSPRGRGRFRWGRPKSELPAREVASQAPVSSAGPSHHARPVSRASSTHQVHSEEPPRSRLLSVHFNYNGHSWEAHEVLGLPAGSSVESAREACSKIEQSADAASKAFFQAALKAIESHKGADTPS